MKRCTKCGLSVDEGAVFGKDKSGKNGLRCRCKECNKQSLKKYRQSEKYKEILKKYGLTKERKESLKRYSQSEKGKKKRKEFRQTKKYKDKRREYERSEKRIAAKKKYHQSKNGRAAQKRARQTEATKRRRKKYYAKNSISVCIASGIRSSLKGNKNGRNWEAAVGWSLQRFKRRFAQLFKKGMTWENHGEVWEIDHIDPVSAHNITSMDCTDFKRAWALSNLQPLFKEENRSKNNKLEKHFQPTLF